MCLMRSLARQSLRPLACTSTRSIERRIKSHARSGPSSSRFARKIEAPPLLARGVVWAYSNVSGTKTLRGNTVIVNTGTRAKIGYTPGLSDERPLTHVEALDLDRLPAHLVVLGGRYVGLELTQAMRRLGSQVTIVERNRSLLHREDADVTDAIEDLFKAEGINVATGTSVRRVEGRSGERVRLHIA